MGIASSGVKISTAKARASSTKGPRTKEPKEKKISKHGIPYPSLPVGVVKKLASTFGKAGGNGKSKINKDTMTAIMQATDWFFEQVGDDLGAYARHAKRKTIDESDVVTLMKRCVLEVNPSFAELLANLVPCEL